MSSIFPSKQELDGMSVGQLQELTGRIIDKEDELLLDEILRRKKGVAPLLDQVYRGDVPNIQTKEQEEYWQKILDDRLEALKNKSVPIEVKEEVKEEIVKEEIKEEVITEKVEEVINPILEETPIAGEKVEKKKQGRPKKIK